MATFSAFRKYHLENRHVYVELKRLARAMKATGRETYSMYSLFEVVRWNISLQTTGDEWKLNNSYRPWYARLLLLRNPDLEEFFELRHSQADRYLEQIAELPGEHD
jgi:hypothetical protein